MKVITHQTICKTQATIARDRGGKKPQKFSAIDIVDEERVLSDAARHHVIDRAAKSYPVLASHAATYFKFWAQLEMPEFRAFRGSALARRAVSAIWQ